MTAVTRPTLGPMMSLTCFHYLRGVAEDTAGRALVIAAGRQRGLELAEALNLSTSSQEASLIKEKLGAALGAGGTQLCLVDMVAAKPNGGYEVQISEGACTAGVTSSEPYCAFTLGVFIGAITAITGRRMLGRETECSAMGGAKCVYHIDPLE